MPKTKPLFANDAVTFAEDPYTAAAGCDALLILTEWSQFATLDLQRMRTLLRHPILIDGRNLYPPDQVAGAGLIYYSVGRSVGIPETMPSAIAYAGQDEAKTVEAMIVQEKIVQAKTVSFPVGHPLNGLSTAAGEA
jgi:hypothetical protein